MRKLAMNPGRVILPMVMMALVWLAVLGSAFAQDVNFNANQTPLALAARTATNSTVDQVNMGWRGAVVLVNVTVAPGGDTITVSIQGKDPASANYYTILTGAAETTTGLKVYKVYPGVTAAANAAASDIIPQTWRVTITHSAGTSFTYSVSYYYEK